MANDGTVKIGVELEEKEFENGIKDLNKKSQSLAKELKEVDKALKLDPKNVELATQKQDLLSQAVSETTKKIEVLKKAEADAAKSPSSDKTAANYRALQREIAKAEAEFKNYNSALSQNSSEAKTASNATDKLERETKQYGDEAEQAADKSEKLKSSLSTIGSVAKTAVGVAAGAITAVTAALGAGLKQGLEYNALIESYQTSFEVMTGSAEKAADVVERLKKIGAETPFELTDLADVTQLLMNYGFTADEAIDRMNMLGDISQGNAEKMQRIATAYGQMSSAGKVQLEDVKQMIEAGFNPLQEIAESTGESMDSLYDRISEGTLAVDEITAAMQRATSEGGKYFQSMEKQSQTFEGLMSTLKDNANQLLGDVVKPIFDGIAQELLPGAIDSIDQLSTAFKERGVEGLIEAGGQVLSNILTGMIKKIPDAVNIAIQIIDSLVRGLLDNTPQIATALVGLVDSLSNSLVDLSPLIISTMLFLVEDISAALGEKSPEIISSLVESIIGAVSELAQHAPYLLEAALDILDGIMDGLLVALPRWFEEIPKITGMLWAGIIDALPDLLPQILELIVKLGELIVQSAPLLVSYLPVVLSYVGNALWGLLDEYIIQPVKDWFNELIGRIVDYFAYLGDGISDGIDKIGEFLLESWNNIVSFFTEDIPAFIQSVIDWFADLPYKIGYYVGLIFAYIIKLGQDIWEWITVDLPQIINSIVNWFAELPSRIWTWLLETIEKIKLWATEMYETAKAKVLYVIDSIVEWFAELPGRIWTWLMNTVEKIKLWAIEMYETAKAKVLYIVDGIVEWFKDLPDKIKQVGKDLVTGFIDGIKSMGTWMGEQVDKFFSGAIDGAKDVLGVHSPSVIFKEIGMFVDEGFAEGIDQGEAKIKKAFENLKISDKFKKMLPDVQAGISGRLQLATAGIGSSGSTSRIETVKTINRNTTQRVEIVANPSGIYDVVQSETKRRGKKL